MVCLLSPEAIMSSFILSFLPNRHVWTCNNQTNGWLCILSLLCSSTTCVLSLADVSFGSFSLSTPPPPCRHVSLNVHLPAGSFLWIRKQATFFSSSWPTSFFLRTSASLASWKATRAWDGRRKSHSLTLVFTALPCFLLWSVFAFSRGRKEGELECSNF